MAVFSSLGFARVPPSPRTALSSACSHSIKMCASSASPSESKKTVWVWTTNRQVMTAAVERGWSTFLFGSKDLGKDWRAGTYTTRQCGSGKHRDRLPRWMAENIVAAFQGCRGTVLAVSTNSTEAQALEQGLDGVILKVEDMDDIIKLKAKSQLMLTKATVSKVEVVGMGDRVCVDLCSMMRPGEGLLVGSYARGMFLVHSECLETNYIASRPFRVNAGPVHAYVAVPGGRTSYLSELQSGREVIVVDQNGLWRTAIVGRVKIESRPLILVEAKENGGDDTNSIFLQNAETVALITPEKGSSGRTAIPVTSLKVGDEVLVRKQGGARHTGIEIQEFIVEK
uniref:3-dehydroquinate synthase n=1 Tax=Oryza meridionalis TaxID=40149 RepID=A0A0E0CVU0_9ORYZ